MLLGSEDEGEYYFDDIVHCTNRQMTDAELLTINEGGILMPEYDGFPHYTMSKKVPERGARYAELSLGLLKESMDQKISSLDYDKIFLHTGSQKIVDGVCQMLGMEKCDKRAEISYEILNNYANLSAVSIPMMLADTIKRGEQFHNALIISFGVGFSASSGVIRRH